MNRQSAPRFQLTLEEVESKGRGVIAREPIPAGSHILDFVGPVVNGAQVADHGLFLQVGNDAFLGSSGGLDDYVNHACEPNCGLRPEGETIRLVAIRDIAPGEELTFDYSTWMTGGIWRNETWQVEGCGCGGPGCRGQVVDFMMLPIELRERYLAWRVVPAFVQENTER